MPSFTEPSKNQTEKEIPENFNFETSVLVMAKKMGLSFLELKEMTMQEFIDFLDLWVGEDGPNDPTQKDIDYFYSNM